MLLEFENKKGSVIEFTLPFFEYSNRLFTCLYYSLRFLHPLNSITTQGSNPPITPKAPNIKDMIEAVELLVNSKTIIMIM